MHEKGDFSADRRLLLLSAMAMFIGVVSIIAAVMLLDLIAFFTNLFFFHRFSMGHAQADLNQLGWAAALCPVVGALIIGLMARYGSEKIRGDGIPEAVEAILYGKSRMDLKVAILKPLSSALSIGSGGPFGAEGPIIMTSGAFGSLIAQAFRLTAAERKTLLVAGAAGGMTAIFGAPVASVLLGVELLLFEWKPRSVIPVAMASVVAGFIRPYVMGEGPLFPMPPSAPVHGVSGLAAAILVGLLAGLLSIVVTMAVYKIEDTFDRLPIHWAWWPAMGAVVVGIGGLIEPRALGVGYDVIADLLTRTMAFKVLLVLFVVKTVIWSTALGSGTSGGVLAPLLIIGGTLGALLDPILPGGGQHLWTLVCMAGAFGGTMRCPLTSVVLAFELTHNTNALLPMLIAGMLAHGLTVLALRRSIVTEKIARRGYHIRCEFEIDPLECTYVEDAMSKDVDVVPATMPVSDLTARLSGKRQGFPVVDAEGKLVGMVTRSSLMQIDDGSVEPLTAGDIMERDVIVALPGETCRDAAQRMVSSSVGRLPVVDPADLRQLVGIITRSDVMRARLRLAHEEQHRERFFNILPGDNGHPSQPVAGTPQ